MEPLFTTAEAALQAGLPLRTLNRYKAIGLAQPAQDRGEGRGRGARYTMREVAIIAGVRCLLEAGLPIRLVRPIAQRWREHPALPIDPGQLFPVGAGLPPLTLPPALAERDRPDDVQLAFA